MFKKKVFICYAHEDQEVAKKLYKDLRQAGIEPWLDIEESIKPENWEETILQAIKDSSFFLLLLSSNSVSKKGFVQKEIKTALDIVETLPPSQRFILPIRLDESKPTYQELDDIQEVDLFPYYQAGLKRIINAITHKESVYQFEPTYFVLNPSLFEGYSEDLVKNSANSSSDSIFDNKLSSRRKQPLQELKILKQRYNFLLKLTRSDLLAGKFKDLFPYTSGRVKWSLQIDDLQHASLSHYISFLTAINILYKLILTIIKPEYFVAVWLNGETSLSLEEGDELIISEIIKQSPQNIQGTGLAIGLKALGDALSIGKQYQDIRMAHVKVEEAKLELKKKQLEIANSEREVQIKEKLTEPELAIATQEKELELQSLKNKLEEEELNLRSKRRKDIEETLELFSKWIKLLKEMPEEMREGFKETLLKHIEQIYLSPYQINQFQMLEEMTEE